MKSRVRPSLIALSVLAGLALLALVAAATLALALRGKDNVYFERTPREVALWLIGRSGADSKSGWLARHLLRLDRGEVGWAGLPDPAYTGVGSAPAVALPEAQRLRLVGSPEQWLQAMEQADAGDRIVLQPGRYEMQRMLRSQRNGTARRPIVVVAQDPSQTLIAFQTTVGIEITHAHWQFHDLRMEGACAIDHDCEHAFHIKGAAHHFVLRNSLLRDFNAHLKINREGQAQPEQGELAHNTLTYTRIRQTTRPTTAVDLLAGANWRIHHNHVSDFVNESPRHPTYGMFAKGGAAGTVFDSNTIFCEHKLRGALGQRVGLSFGNGGTSPGVCRNGQGCDTGEHVGGEMRNNLIVGCSAAGIFLNRAHQAVLRHNTLLDTGGIQARFPDSVVRLEGNWVDGPLLTRDGALMVASDTNHAEPLWRRYTGWSPARGVFRDLTALDLRWRSQAPEAFASSNRVEMDLCGQPRPVGQARPGAFQDFSACLAAKPRAANAYSLQTR